MAAISIQHFLTVYVNLIRAWNKGWATKKDKEKLEREGRIGAYIARVPTDSYTTVFIAQWLGRQRS